jgi:hypothetical protein
MFTKRILVITFVLVIIGTATLFIAQAATLHTPQARPTPQALNPALYGEPHFLGPCEMDTGVNYVDGKWHGTPSPGQIGVNYIDGKVHKRDIPLFTPDDEILCPH